MLQTSLKRNAFSLNFECKSALFVVNPPSDVNPSKRCFTSKEKKNPKRKSRIFCECSFLWKWNGWWRSQWCLHSWKTPFMYQISRLIISWCSSTHLFPCDDNLPIRNRFSCLIFIVMLLVSGEQMMQWRDTQKKLYWVAWSMLFNFKHRTPLNLKHERRH